jgi:hypothetical protein
VRALFPADAALNLPRRRYSWGLQQLAVLFTRVRSYGQARKFVRAATGISIGKRQLEQITAGAAAAPRAPASGYGTSGKRRGTGEKGHKRMAQAGCVFGVAVPDQPRTPEQILARQPGREPPQAPRAAGQWYTAGIAGGAAETIAALSGQAGRRDPARARTWIALAGGDNRQIGQIQDQAAARGVAVTILIDFVHVQEYLRKAAWCFHAPRDPAIEAWVTAQELDILHGRAAQVTAWIPDLAAAHPPRAGSEHDKIIAKTLAYLQNKQPYLDCPRALASGWPIATGVIEGACRHLTGDRTGITGARWSGAGAQSHLAAPRHRRQRRPGRLLEPPHRPGTPAQPPKPLPARPPTRRMTRTPKRATPMSHRCGQNHYGVTSPWLGMGTRGWLENAGAYGMESSRIEGSLINPTSSRPAQRSTS